MLYLSWISLSKQSFGNEFLSEIIVFKSLKRRYINLSPKEKYRGKILCIVLLDNMKYTQYPPVFKYIDWCFIAWNRKNNKVYSIYRGLICLIYIICRYLFTLFDNNSWSMFKVPVMIRVPEMTCQILNRSDSFKISSSVTWKRLFKKSILPSSKTSYQHYRPYFVRQNTVEP